MHLTGLLGMPRRVYTYQAHMGWTALNMITTIGAFIFAFGLLLTLINVIRSRSQGAVAGPNPWDAYTLEWAVPSPPPPYNFAVIPYVATRHPLWEDRIGPEGVRSILDQGLVLAEGKETLFTTALDAEPDMVAKMPEDTPAPFFLTVGLVALFVGMLTQRWWLALAGVVVIAASLVVWLWPRRDLAQVAGSPL